MSSETSMVAASFRLQEWAAQIRECQSRPAGMSVASWCADNGITKANYYYRLCRVRFLRRYRMLNDATCFKAFYIVCGYTDYKRSIIIREDCCNLW